MVLSKNETLLLAYQHNRFLADENRFKINCKIKAKCLKCFDTIYIGYFTGSIKSIFCDAHKHLADDKNIAQLQYFRVIKEKGYEQLTK